MNFQQITISDFGSVKFSELRKVWTVETPFTSDAFRTGYSDAHSGNRSTKAARRSRTFLSQQAAEKFLSSAYARHQKANTLPLKTEVIWRGVPGWLSPELTSGGYKFWPANSEAPGCWLSTLDVNSDDLTIIGDEE